MPEPQRRFLTHVSSTANIRPYVESRRADRSLNEAYNSCLRSLAAYRNKHVQIVTRYVILPSRAAARKKVPEAKRGTAGCVPAKVHQPQEGSKESAVLGTGGTSPMVFLKQIRDQTQQAVIPGEGAQRGPASNV